MTDFNIQNPRELLIQEYQISPNLNALLGGIFGLIQKELIDPLELLAGFMNPDNAHGVWLDYLMERLGGIRTGVRDQDIRFFGFENRLGFDQGPMYDEVLFEILTPIGDEAMRNIIAARALFLFSGTTRREIEAVLASLFATERTYLLGSPAPRLVFGTGSSGVPIPGDDLLGMTPYQNLLYGISTTNLISIRLSDRNLTDVASLTLGPSVLRALAVLNDLFYSLANTDNLYSLTPAGVVTLVGSLSVSNLESLTEHQGTLYCASSGAAGSLYSVDPDDASLTAIGNTGVPLTGLTSDDILLYGVTAGGAIYSINTTNAAATLLYTHPGLADVQAVAIYQDVHFLFDQTQSALYACNVSLRTPLRTAIYVEGALQTYFDMIKENKETLIPRTAGVNQDIFLIS